MQREKRGLGQQSRRHQRRRRPDRRQRVNPLRQQRHIERAIGAIEQRGAEQVADGAKQREQQIAQRRRQRLRPAVDADQRHGGESQKLKRDIEVEQVAADENNSQRRPDRLKHDPEGQRRPAFGHAGRGRKFGARVKTRGGENQRRRDEHDCRDPVGAQCDAERRRMSADGVNQRLAQMRNPGGDGQGKRQP